MTGVQTCALPICTGLVAPRHVGCSWTRARTCVPCIGRQSLNHCATREVPNLAFFKSNSLAPSPPLISYKSKGEKHSISITLNFVLSPSSPSPNSYLSFPPRNLPLYPIQNNDNVETMLKHYTMLPLI